MGPFFVWDPFKVPPFLLFLPKLAPLDLHITITIAIVVVAVAVVIVSTIQGRNRGKPGGKDKIGQINQHQKDSFFQRRSYPILILVIVVVVVDILKPKSW